MITDALGTFTDSQPITSAGNSDSIAVMPYIGRTGTAYISLLATEPYTDGATMTVDVQESDDDSTFETVASFVFPLHTPHGQGMMSIGFPGNITKKHVRLAYKPSGASAGKLWAGVTRDDIKGMVPGLYIHKGKVVA